MGRRGGFGGGGRGGFGGRSSLGGRSMGGRSSLGGGRSGGTLGGSRGGGGLTSGGLGGRSPAPRTGGGFGRPAPRRRGPGFGTGMAVGMGMGMGMGRRRRWGFGPRWGWGGRRMHVGGMHGGHRGGGGCGGCLTILVILLLFAIILAFVQGGGNQLTRVQDEFAQSVVPSTVIREPLPANSASTAGPWFTDELGWIQNPTALQAGLRNFHNATGVRPHVYLSADMGGRIDLTAPNIVAYLTANGEAHLEAYAEELYDRLFDDEAHVLLVFFEWPGNAAHEPIWMFNIAPGRQARAVVDQEAVDIISDFIVLYYFQQELSEELVFSGAFDRAATRIMHRPDGPIDNRPVWITIAIVLGVILLAFILFNWWKRKKEQQNLEAEQTERILNQPLESFGEDEATQRAQEYEE